MNANNIVDALLEGRPRKRAGQSAEPIIQAWIDACGGDEAALAKIQLRCVRAACICARQVLPKVPAKHKQVCLAAIEAAEAWAADPSEANRLKADKAGDAAWAAEAAAWATGAAWAAVRAAVRAAEAAVRAAVRAAEAAYWAYKADPSINFLAQIAAKMAEYPVIEGLHDV